MPETALITLEDADGSQAQVAPQLGGWLLRYSRVLPKHGRVEALHCTDAVVQHYPRGMYAGIPVLFPLVGRSQVGGQDHQYEWNGARHGMPQHGFARRSKWSVLDQTRSSVTMELIDNETTRADYPFSFRHTLSYRLVQGRLHWEQVIENRSEKPLPFSTGFHPYFAVPLSSKGERSACFVELPDAKRLTAQGNLERFTAEPFPGQNWSVAEDVAGTMFLTDLRRQEVALIDPGSELEVLFNFEEAPRHRFLAIWARTPEEPFYCIEPWTALPNAFSRLKDRELICLEQSKTFRAAMWLELRTMV